MSEKVETKKEWEKARLGDICVLNMGQSPDSKTYNKIGDGLPFFQGKTDFGAKFPSLRIYCNEPRKIAEDGDILISVRAPVGPVNIANTKSCIGRGLAALRAKQDLLDQIFLYFNLILSEKEIAALGTGSTFHAINKNQLASVEIPLPTIKEQKAIARALTTVQEAIAGQEELIVKLKELKRSMMQFLFTHGAKSEKTKMTEIGEIPESWELVELASVAKIERGKFDHRPRNAPQFYGGKYPFIQTGDITKSNGHIKKYSQTLNDAGLAISKNFPVGTIFITIAANIGYTAISEIEMACPDSLVGISPYLHTINVEFLNYYLTTQQPIMDAMAPRGTQKNINIEFLKPWKIILPSIKEQEKIAGLLLSIDKKIESAQNKLSVYQSLFKTLLHELMSGERKVKI